MSRFVIPVLFALAACAQFPEVDAASRDIEAAAPPLLPLDQILPAPPPEAEARGAALSARAAALRAQAAAR
ncbi:MAG: hypothetical protein ACRC14_15485 [Paracoccaceae bacterium]